MLRKLGSQQIRDHWGEIKPAILACFPRAPGNIEQWMNKLLLKTLQDEAHVWIGLDEENKISLVVVTAFVIDPCGEEKHLLIYALYGFKTIPRNLAIEVPVVLMQFAKDTDCKAVVAYSSVPSVVSLSEKIGADTKTTYLQWRIQ